MIGNPSLLKAYRAGTICDRKIWLTDGARYLKRIEKPGRDPRASFKTVQFQEGVETLAHLKPGMILEGVVTNVANFGAFVDIGVHQDGLVHISALADKFVKDPRDVVKAGQIVKVKVLEVDIPRKRISLTMRLETPAEKLKHHPHKAEQQRQRATPTQRTHKSTAPAAPAVSRLR